ncbi:MAG: phosphoglucosamine mutase [Acidimicrobiales bacterium]|nr:phosphoglucosamine mutase [Acidimicrobiales bacterium]MYJ46850.1 phosphoglucosamine mutase [Acidimicrobiales bacterium]
MSAHAGRLANSHVFFGTDGVRGRAFDEIDEVVAHALGRAANRALLAGNEAARWSVGRDTRESGPALARALVAGLRATGAEVIDLGIAPTPVVAFAAQRLDTAGAVVSASHNPWHDNGVKLFAAGGTKLSDAEQAAVAQCLDELRLTHGDRPSAAEIARRPDAAPAAGAVGAQAASPNELDRVLDAYEHSLRAAVDGRTLDGLHLVVDGANGASASLAPAALQRLGAQVTALFCEPDGRNINDGCGSVNPGTLGAAVLDVGADLGVAFDGDGDRMIAVDCEGQVIDGDRQMALFAVDLAERDLLAGDTLVATVMSNMGLRRAMSEAGIEVVTTAVGDRAVLEALEAGGHCLGGEQSGHVVFRHEATTGDGLRSAVHLADLVARRAAGDSALTSAELSLQAMQVAPQVLRNVPADPGPLADATQRAVDDIAAGAGPDVRVLVRASGTEPVIRIMVEAPTEREAMDLSDRLTDVIVEGVGAAGTA